MCLCHRPSKNGKFSKRNSKFHLKLQKLRVKPKKHEQFLENYFLVHRASFYCKRGLPLTKPRYEN